MKLTHTKISESCTVTDGTSTLGFLKQVGKSFEVFRERGDGLAPEYLAKAETRGDGIAMLRRASVNTKHVQINIKRV